VGSSRPCGRPTVDNYCQQKVQIKAKALPCNVACASSRETKTDIPSLSDSEEKIILTAELNVPLVAVTRSGQSYLKKYDEIVANPPKLTPEPIKKSTKQPVEKQKELRYAKALLKDKAEGSLAPYRFDVLAQLANIPTRFTLYVLLRLSKLTREALRETLADVEAFITRIPAKPQKKDKEDCLYTSQHAPCITFTLDDIHVRGKQDRPLYFTGYIESSEVSCIQVDLGSVLSIIPYWIMQHLGIPTH